MLTQNYILAAACAAAPFVNADWISDLQASIRSQAEAQVQASLQNAVPSIVSQSVNNAINSQLQQYTQAPTAPAAPAAPVDPAAPAGVAATQATSNNQAAQPAAQPAANDQPAATQVATNRGTNSGAGPANNGGFSNSGGSASNNQGQAANGAVGGGNAAASLAVADGSTYQASDIKTSTFANGAVVTLAGGHTISGSIITLSSNATTSGATKNATISSNSNHGNGTAPVASKGLSKGAVTGIGVGMGLLALAAIGGFLVFRRWSQRRRKNERSPDIIISGPLEARQNGDVDRDNKTAELGNTSYAKEMDGVGKPPSTDPSIHPASSTRSPVSPYTPGSATTGSAHQSPLQQRPNIYEMLGSEPVEMPASQLAGAEVAGSEPALELSSAVEAKHEPQENGKPARPFSFVETPIDAFIAEKKSSKNVVQNDGTTRGNNV